VICDVAVAEPLAHHVLERSAVSYTVTLFTGEVSQPSSDPMAVSIDTADDAAAKIVRLMLAFFGDGEISRVRTLAPESIPAPYRRLLAHAGHMTEVLERHHGGALRVQPYRIRREGDLYGRRIDLFAAGVHGPVMTGIMIFNLALVAPAVRDEIVGAQSPLGEILIRHRILRRVAADAFLAFEATDPLAARFGSTANQPAYGRLATIDCDRRPAVDLLEIVRP
jgi:chorismate-pyruvate lyase